MPLGAVLGSILGPFWGVFLTSVRLWRATGERERRGAEKQEKAQTHSLNFNSFSDVGSSVFSSFWRRRRKRAPRKKHVFAWKVLHYSLVRLFARNEKEESYRSNFQRKRAPTAKRKRRARASSATSNKDTKHEHFGVKNRSKFGQKRVRKQLPTPSCFQERVGRLLASIFGPFLVPKSAQKRSRKQAGIQKRFFERDLNAKAISTAYLRGLASATP